MSKLIQRTRVFPANERNITVSGSKKEKGSGGSNLLSVVKTVKTIVLSLLLTKKEGEKGRKGGRKRKSYRREEYGPTVWGGTSPCYLGREEGGGEEKHHPKSMRKGRGRTRRKKIKRGDGPEWQQGVTPFNGKRKRFKKDKGLKKKKRKKSSQRENISRKSVGE